ncbi:hypothetical protein ATO2_17630 [Roseovarius sp. 22II1-1F6A]|nr:hypothetical protein ATO2_17630 [Roseovarius sp. 22II1-1F6A]
MIKELEAGTATAKLCWRHGLSTATFYKLKAKYSGIEVSEAARLKVPSPRAPTAKDVRKYRSTLEKDAAI